MAVNITSYPPLGRVTSIKDTNIKFTVLLESDSQSESDAWEVQIWHNLGQDEWTALPLEKSPSDVPAMGGPTARAGTRLVYEGEISHLSGPGNFTIRYKCKETEDWQWVNKEQNIDDGELVFLSENADSAGDFSRYFDRLSPDIIIEGRKSEAPGAELWHLSGSVDAAGEESGTADIALGLPSSVSRFFALVRVNASWLGPRQGKDRFSLGEDAILCSFLRKDGIHVVLLGVSVDNILTVLGSGSQGEVVIKSRNDNPKQETFQVLAAAADNFEISLSALIYEARKLVRPYDIAKDIDVQWRSSWSDGLTYCTWNGLGQDLSEDKILSALDDLKIQGISISNLIIDDNWQSLDNEGSDQSQRGWTQFEANPKAFPNGLAKTVATIKERHSNIKHISVWHALLGYWGGISPDGELAKKYTTKQVYTGNPQSSILVIDPSDINRFYNDFYTFLSSSGIDGTKADAQSTLDVLTHPPDRTSLTTPYLDALSISSLRHFSSCTISSMSLFPQAIFHSHLPPTKPATPLRNSDDFFPDIPDSHAWHVFANAHNALLTRTLNVLPDWDMFMTLHPWGGFHAAARAVSGGPIAITDKPHEHDLSIIKQVTALTPQGNTTILRPANPGRALGMYNDINAGGILKIGTFHGRAGTGSGIMGLFNLDGKASPSSGDRGPKSGLVRVDEFPGVYDKSGGKQKQKYIVRAHRTGVIKSDLTPSSVISVSVDEGANGWDILTVFPSRQFTFKDITTNVAVLGLLGKMTGAAAVVNSDIYIQTNGRLRVDISLKALGVLGVYISELVHWDIDEHFMVLVSGQAVPRKTVWRENGCVLAVDIEEAWNSLGLEAGWSNEVHVSVLM
ncbi:raffinose synthase or seed imbibition protein Sip1-domain-containing protein [Aspergillus unguis]